MSKSIMELIQKRKSVRSYTNDLLSSTLVEELKHYIAHLSAPFGVQARVEWVSTHIGDKPMKLGTYGIISGAQYFLCLLLEKNNPMAEVGGGYLFEQVVLHCTALDLGTCWLGATFNASHFLKQISLNENEELAIISPVGHKKEKRSMVESLMRSAVGSDNRKEFGQLFYRNNFNESLDKKSAGYYKIPLEMVRLAPSASNKQPWRVLQEDNGFHFYHLPNRFSLFDMGIALCHFEQTCKELKLNGCFQALNSISSIGKLEYCMSWIPEQ